MAKTSKTAVIKKRGNGYDCDKVEEYIDEAIERVNKEILPLIQTLDERDKDQYDTAKKIIVDSIKIIDARNEVVENTVKKMKEEMEEVFQSRKQMINQLTGSFTQINEKLDIHITDESEEFRKIREGLTKAAGHVETIQNTLDNVSANGNKGLGPSLADMYSKLHELQDVTQGVRARAKFYTALHDIVTTTPFLKPLKYKWGVIVYVAIFILLLNTVLHALGVEFNLFGLLAWLVTFGKVS